MSRWKRHSDDGSRGPCAVPSSVIATTSTGCIDAYANPVGVTRKPSSVRALTLPDLPRFKPCAFISRAVAMMLLRKASSSMGMLRKQPGQSGVGCGTDAALGDEAREKATGRYVERRISRDSADRCDWLAAGI